MVIVEIQELSDMNSEELRDAIISLRLVNDIGDEANKIGLPNSAVEFVEELKYHASLLCPILEEQMVD